MFGIGNTAARGGREARLDPVRWPRPPRRATLIRLVLVAVLLATAAGALYAGPPAAPGCRAGTSAAGGPPRADRAARPFTQTPTDQAARRGGEPGASTDQAAPSGPGSTDEAVPPGEEAGASRDGAPGAEPHTRTDGAAEPGDAARRPPGGGRLALPRGSVGVAISLAEPAALAVLRAGDRVDLLTVPSAPTGPATTLASAALVLVTPGGPGADPAAEPGALYLALTPRQARKALALPANTRFAVIVRG